MLDGRPHRAHRIAWTLLRGDIPEKLVIDHLCRNRSCVNPWHMEPVTNQENIDRGLFRTTWAPLKTHCPQKHEYTDDNTRIDPCGHRRCRICERTQSLAAYYRRKQRITA